MHRATPRRRIARLGLIAAVIVVAAACGSDEAGDYESDNKEALLASCADAAADDLLQQRLCLCVFDEAERTMGFERFSEIEDLLADDDDAPLPPDLVEIVVACAIEEADL